MLRVQMQIYTETMPIICHFFWPATSRAFPRMCMHMSGRIIYEQN